MEHQDIVAPVDANEHPTDFHYTFTKVERHWQHMHDVNVLRSLRQWGLVPFMTMETYSFPEEYKDVADTSAFIRDLFSNDEFIETFVIPGNGGRNYRFPTPNVPRYERMRVTAFSRAFFAPFHEDGKLAVNHHLLGCEAREVDMGTERRLPIQVETVAHALLLGEPGDGEEALLPEGFTDELLGKLLALLLLGGGLNQYSTDFDEYEHAATLLYRDLIVAKRLPDGQVGTECCVYEIKGLGDIHNFDLFPIQPDCRVGNLCVLSIHPTRHQATVFHVGYKKAY